METVAEVSGSGRPTGYRPQKLIRTIRTHSYSDHRVDTTWYYPKLVFLRQITTCRGCHIWAHRHLIMVFPSYSLNRTAWTVRGSGSVLGHLTPQPGPLRAVHRGTHLGGAGEGGWTRHRFLGEGGWDIRDEGPHGGNTWRFGGSGLDKTDLGFGMDPNPGTPG